MGRVMGIVGMYVQPLVSLAVSCTQLFQLLLANYCITMIFLELFGGILGYAFVLKLLKSFKSDFFGGKLTALLPKMNNWNHSRSRTHELCHSVLLFKPLASLIKVKGKVMNIFPPFL